MTKQLTEYEINKQKKNKNLLEMNFYIITGRLANMNFLS